MVTRFRRKILWKVTEFLIVLTGIVVGVALWNLTHSDTQNNPKRFVIIPPSDAQICTANGSDVTISPDGNQFLLGESDEKTVLSIRVVLNWFDELKSLVPKD